MWKVLRITVLGNWRCCSLNQKEHQIRENGNINDEFHFAHVGLKVPMAQPGKAVPLAQERDLAQRYAFESHQYAGGS